jgi:hypothetical protein
LGKGERAHAVDRGGGLVAGEAGVVVGAGEAAGDARGTDSIVIEVAIRALLYAFGLEQLIPVPTPKAPIRITIRTPLPTHPHHKSLEIPPNRYLPQTSPLHHKPPTGTAQAPRAITGHAAGWALNNVIEGSDVSEDDSVGDAGVVVPGVGAAAGSAFGGGAVAGEALGAAFLAGVVIGEVLGGGWAAHDGLAIRVDHLEAVQAVGAVVWGEAVQAKS